jgi:hypothetical protein
MVEREPHETDCYAAEEEQHKHDCLTHRKHIHRDADPSQASDPEAPFSAASSRLSHDSAFPMSDCSLRNFSLVYSCIANWCPHTYLLMR